ncbi:MAG: hypothetical protein FWF03_00470 [Defluviitaleaceae bacterium]|nr:hypothetical protein [Defluviitaleaceae bacterium]
MHKIIKARETMTPRERVARTFAYEKTDRVPIGYGANPAIGAKVTAALGAKNNEELHQILGVDYRGVGAPYAGPNRFKQLPGRNVDPVYGFYTRWVENDSGGYADFCDFPLMDANCDEIEAFKFPSPDEYDYAGVPERAKACGNLALYCGGAGTGDIINSIGRIMGMEDALVNIQTRDGATLDLIDRKISMEAGVMERVLEAARGRIDFVWLGEDLGTQHVPMIGKELFREVFRPRHKIFIDLANHYNIPVMIHTCGSSSWAYEDFIEMGVKAVDTLQPEAADMSPEYLIEKFGGRLAFHGCISTTGTLSFGTADETYEYCERTLGLMMANGGYFFAPCHLIQDNTPAENVLAMYACVHERGVYD